MAGCPSAAPLRWRHGSLSDNIGDAEPARDRRPQPIGCLVINMIRKPKIRRRFRKLPVAAEKAVGDPFSQCSQPGLSEGIAISVIAAKPRNQKGLVSAVAQGCKQ